MGGCVVGSRRRAGPGWGPALQHLLTEGLGGTRWVTGTRGSPGTPRVRPNVCGDVCVERAPLTSQQSVRQRVHPILRPGILGTDQEVKSEG